MTDTLEETAQRIAERGRDALLERLRPAFKDAAAKHADVLELSDEQIEQMVQRAADRADGLQWRRALAGVATDELGIGLGEALSHPAVSRAQAIVGAPSYEESLEAVAARRPRPPAPSAPEPEAEEESPETVAPESEPDPEPTPTPEPEPEPAAAEPEPEPDPTEPDPAAPAAEATLEPTPIAAADVAGGLDGGDEPNDSVRLAVIHLGGVANLTQGERDIELRISHLGLDIVRGSEEVLGQLTWGDIQTLSVPPAKGIRRRRRESRAHLVIHTDRGDASFEVPALAPDELREHLTPVVERHGHTVQTH